MNASQSAGASKAPPKSPKKLTDAQIRQLLKDHGLTYGDVTAAFANLNGDDKVDKALCETVRKMARDAHEDEGEVEIDDNALIHWCDDDANGAYVQAAVWVPFSGTPLDTGAFNDDYQAYVKDRLAANKKPLPYQKYLKAEEARAAMELGSAASAC
jgi:hypothetical protein